MYPSSFVLTKAKEYDIDITADPTAGSIYVYRTTIKSIRTVLRDDPRQLVDESIDAIIDDLRELVNEIDDLREGRLARMFIGSGLVKSLDALFFFLQEAYREFCIASDLLKSNSMDIESQRRSFYTAVFNCREALRKALEQFNELAN